MLDLPRHKKQFDEDRERERKKNVNLRPPGRQKTNEISQNIPLNLSS